MKKLYLTFENENGKKTSITPKVFAENLETDVVRQAMDEMAGLGIFHKDEYGLYAKVAGARYVETIETPLFSVDK
ncbi:hypothetical protein CIRMBP1312_00460 [Enterococcus cecorum]|uniref:DUF2922 domain-containing protein n=1 Tax=Enterococcus cecorum TaxID=44008 RepID=UPI0006435C01|nr:DUF2922 domain-containing protein [Enterococcus cecorum]KLO66558.1 hypothetical protein AA986_05785 [Enterococcus cecorum]CAI3329027.1 hypothetical protein CIRMBP1315_00213 [Enterococcus cecorum]CAI3346908.1 hypothetical protein CIRMBP1312_00460 [Enterococcus cecorum]CAI3398141.1 hypothetical protein CIRMBP1222_01381 [Enterococcus cecorum]